jgi:N-acetylmuramoyl-L-alanine amidase
MLRPVLAGGLMLLGGLGCAKADASADETAAMPALPGDYVAAAIALKPLGLRPVDRMTPEGDQSFANAWSRISLRHDSREIYLDGRRIFLTEAVVAHQGQLWLSNDDVESTLHPVLRPHDFADAAKVVRRIWLDAGHGGKDRGTHNDPLALSEKDLTLDVALRLEKILTAQGFTVIQTRREDVYVDIRERGERSRASDLLVSIHFNAAGNPEARGTETYVLTPGGQRSTGDHRSNPADELPTELGNETDPWNAILGFQIHDAMVGKLGTVDRGLKRARFAVLRLTNVPAVLIEAGFLSNEEEASMIASPTRRGEIAESIANGIVAYADLVLSSQPEK